MLASSLGEIVKISIDRDMLLTELYDLRAILTEAALESDEAQIAFMKFLEKKNKG